MSHSSRTQLDSPVPPEGETTVPVSVLIAEDDPDLRDVFTIAFRFHAFRVQTVRNGREAIATLESELPQVLVLDIEMPGVSGLDVLRYIQERGWHQTMQILVVTANSGYRHAPEMEWVTLFLVKPVSVEHLTRFAQRLTA